jgi:hypothetical protein
MLNKLINQSIRDSLNNTTVNLESLRYFASEISRITIHSFWSSTTKAFWDEFLSKAGEQDGTIIEDVLDYLLELNVHLVYNLDPNQYDMIITRGGGGIQVLTREALANSPHVIPAAISKRSFGNEFTIIGSNGEQGLDRLSSLIFLVRIHMNVFYREIDNRLNKG